MCVCVVLKITFDNRTLSGQYMECLNKLDKLSRQRRSSEDTASNGCRSTKKCVVVEKTVEKFVSEMISLQTIRWLRFETTSSDWEHVTRMQAKM